MRKSKFFAGVMAVAMVLGSLTLPETISMDGIGAISAQAAEVVDSGTWWTLDDEGTLTISDTPPGMCWFGEYSDIITTVVIEDGVTGIVAEMFESCYNMTSITISNSVGFIGTWAFAGCSSLTSIEIPAGVTKISDWVFDGCTSLTNVTFLGDAPEFSVNAFEGRTFTAYYPSNNSTWTDEVMQQYGGEITWVEYEAESNGEETISGDINLDGAVDYLDAMIVLRADAELIELTDAQLKAADVNGDGSVDSLDAILILRYDAGLIDSFE